MKNMTREIEQAVQLAFRGSRKVRVTFRQDVRDHFRLLELERDGFISLSSSDSEALSTGDISGDWNNKRNRTAVVTLTKKLRASKYLFVIAMEHVLENIKVVK